MRIVDGLYEEVRDDSLTIAKALTASGGPLFPPADWYQDPSLDRPTPITVTADGRIYGHIAAWNTDHIGLPPNTRPPRNSSDYQYFKTGVLTLDNGEDVTVGQLTLAGGHAPMTADAAKAVAHYDDTASAVADVTVGEDRHGIWVSGGIRPGVTDEQIRVLRASAPSGDWRPIDNKLELVAVCQVNTPGFPVARAMVASGELTALVAAGSSYMYGLQQEASLFSALEQTEERMRALEAVVASFIKKGKKADDEDDDEVDEDVTPADADADEDDDDEDESDSKPDESETSDEDDDEEATEAGRRAALRAKFKARNKKR